MGFEQAGDERDFIAWLMSQTAADSNPTRDPAARADHRPVRIGLGDDMATIPAPDGHIMLLASDMVLDGTHFHSQRDGLAAAGRKALAACLSDCAAMAVCPVSAVVSLALPRGRVFETGRQVMTAMLACAAEFDCPIVGGDTTSWDGPLAIDVSIAARPWPGLAPVPRSGGRPGDALAVSGQLGGSALGHHLHFSPRIAEARCAAEALGPELHALMDISDGLAIDLQRLCTASGCGAQLETALLGTVASDDARLAAETDDRSLLEHVLHDGEDFELLMAVSTAGVERLVTCGLQHFLIGRLGGDGLRLKHNDRETPLAPGGYVH